MSWFASAFDCLLDPRTGNALRHDLLEVLTMALTAAVGGAESCSDFADFAVDREGLFREFLRLENGVPSHDTFSSIFRLLDPAAFGGCFGRFLTDLGESGAGVVAIDGKTLRRSFDTAAGRSPPAVVSAFASSTRMVIGQESFRAGEGDSEIVAARALLECLDHTGRLVTADALHCRNETARLILDRGGGYLLRLKRNRPAPHEAVRAYFAVPEVLSGLARLGMVEATVTRSGKTTTTRHYHLSSRPLSAEAYLAAARAHWSIENGLHWVLDMTFDEDRARSRKDHAPENLATVRKLALNVLRTARPGISIRRRRKRSGWSDDVARSILGQMQ